MDVGDRLSEQSRWLHLLLVHMTSRRVRARVEIEDLVQEVFLRSLAAPKGMPSEAEGEGALRRFLTRLARNTVFDILRAMRAQKRSGAEVPLARSDWSVAGIQPEIIAARGPGPSTQAIREEEHLGLIRAFESLASEHCRVIGLRQFEGLSAAEAGRRMGRSEAAVHSLYRRALRAWSEAAGPVP